MNTNRQFLILMKLNPDRSVTVWAPDFKNIEARTYSSTSEAKSKMQDLIGNHMAEILDQPFFDEWDIPDGTRLVSTKEADFAAIVDIQVSMYEHCRRMQKLHDEARKASEGDESNDEMP